jgi:tetratricopeptide (TPR) repeat protein
MNTRTMFIGILLACILALLPAKQGFCADGPSADSSATSNASTDFEKKIYQSVKDLDYSDQVAQDFVKMVRPWKCDVLYQKLCQAAKDVTQKKISWDQYAQVETDIVNQLAQKIKIGITDDKKLKCFDLDLVVKEKKAQCLGYTQLFYILGNSMGLTIQAIDVLEHSEGMPVGMCHTACEVGLHNGKAMQVDLTLRDYVSKTFTFTKEYDKAGNYWDLKDKKNRLKIHKRIQLLDKNGLVGGICYNRGTTYAESGKFTEAILDFNKAIELNPKCAVAYYNRGTAYAKSGKFTEANSDNNKAIELNSNNAEAYYNRGTTYAKSGKFTEAISDLNKAIELNSKYAEAYVNRGITNAELGKKEDAKKDLRKAMQLNPGLKDTIKNKADKYKLDL